MRKRLIPLLLLLLLLPCLIVPASATTQDVVDTLDENHSELGEWLGTMGADIVDRLDWLDDTVRDVETAILNGFADTTGKLTAILEEIYTNGALTIGEYVKGIRSYIVDINTKLETGFTQTIGQLVYGIWDNLVTIGLKVGNISNQIKQLVTGDSTGAEEVVEDIPPLQTELDEMEDVLATAPTIDQDGFDTAVDDINGKYQNIYTDEDGTLLFGALGKIGNSAPFSVLIPTSAMLGVVAFALFGRVY